MFPAPLSRSKTQIAARESHAKNRSAWTRRPRFKLSDEDPDAITICEGVKVRQRGRIDLNLLAAFEAIYAHGSVTQAARQLNLSQSAVSHALARLRHDLDDPLFVRSGNELVPTALARSIAAPVQSALRGLDQAVAAASGFDPATTKRLFRIALRQSSEALVFARLVRHVAAVAPGVRLASVNYRRAELARALARGDLDLAVDIASDATKTLCTEALHTDDFVVVARCGHPRIDGAIDLTTYLTVDHVVASPRSSGPGLEDEALAALGTGRQVKVRCQHLWSAWQVVAQTDLVLTLQRSQAQTMTTIADLQLLPLPIAIVPRSLQLCWHEAAQHDPGNAWLRAIVKLIFGDADP